MARQDLSSFTHWLLTQTERPDAVGALARLAAADPGGRGEAAMTNEVERNKALIRAHYEATVNHFDPALIEEQVAEDFFDHAAGTRLGPEGMKQHIQALKAVFPDLHVTLEDLIAEGDRVAVRACWRGTHSAEFQGVPPS